MRRKRLAPLAAGAFALTLGAAVALAHSDDDCVADLEIECDLGAGSDSHKYEDCIDDLIWVCKDHVDPASGLSPQFKAKEKREPGFTSRAHRQDVLKKLKKRMRAQ